MGLFEGNVRSKAPFIAQFTDYARNYSHKKMVAGMMQIASDIFPEAIFAVHLDHGDEETCYDCINSGIFSSVMIDASAMPFEDNVATTKRVVDAAHAKGIVVEGELGQIKGKEGNAEAGQTVCTDPKQAQEYVERTGVDSLACSIGNAHGAVKFSGDQKLHLDILSEIQKRLPGMPLVMHGASSVPASEIARINAAGGHITGTNGVDATQFLAIARLGICKINIDTDGRLVWCRVHREFFRDHPESFDFRVPGKSFMHEYANFIYEKNCMMGSAYQAEPFLATLKKEKARRS